MTAISIAVPVYNGEAMLHDALECLRTQTFGDFEVVILDNASTDGTRAIAQSFVDRDPRFRLIVQPHNKGAMGNFIDGLATASARFFLFRAHDDINDERYLEELHKALVEKKDAYWSGQVDIQRQVALAWVAQAEGRPDEASKAMAVAAEAEPFEQLRGGHRPADDGLRAA